MVSRLFIQGDVVRFTREGYSHLALYVDEDQVVHLWSSTGSDYRVRMDSIRFVQRSVVGCELPEKYSDDLDDKMLTDHELRPFEGDEVVRRAMTRLGDTQYCYLTYNCEHFVTWARYGFEASPQVTSNANQILAGAMVGAMAGGVAGFVVGGLISLFVKADMLTASASLGASMDATSTTGLSSEEHALEAEEDGIHEAERQTRRAARELLWNGLPSTRAPVAMNTMEDWGENRRRRAAADSTQMYSDKRHDALAKRLADEKLQCSICYSNLLRVRAVAFPCNHFTCGACYAAFQVNMEGNKSCPYCRLPIVDVKKIHKSTKICAKRLLHREEK